MSFLQKLAFDIINPLDGLWGRLNSGKMHRFTFDARGEFTGRDVELLLRQYGIRIWGREMVHEYERAFLVKCRQAIWAEYILCRAGIPLTCPLLDARNAEYHHRHAPNTMPTPWQENGISPQSFVDHAVAWIHRFLG